MYGKGEGKGGKREKRKREEGTLYREIRFIMGNGHMGPQVDKQTNRHTTENIPFLHSFDQQ